VSAKAIPAVAAQAPILKAAKHKEIQPTGIPIKAIAGIPSGNFKI